MKIIRNSIIPFKGFAAMNVCGMLFVRKEARITPTLLRHEEIHTAQMKERGYVRFYTTYLYYWLKNMWGKGMTSHEAYRAIPYEAEAYANEKNENYLAERKKDAWKEYMP